MSDPSKRKRKPDIEGLNRRALKSRLNMEADPLRKERITILWLIACGQTYEQTAYEVGRSPSWISQFVRSYKAFGEGALVDRRKSNGSALSLTMSQIALLKAEIEKLHHSCDRITAKNIQDISFQNFGITLPLRTAARYKNRVLKIQ